MLSDFYSIIITKNNPNNYQDRCQDVVNQIKLLKLIICILALYLLSANNMSNRIVYKYTILYGFMLNE